MRSDAVGCTMKETDQAFDPPQIFRIAGWQPSALTNEAGRGDPTKDENDRFQSFAGAESKGC